MIKKYLNIVFSGVNLEFNQDSSSLAPKMDSKSGVVGKFRSFYSTIEQVSGVNSSGNDH